MENASKALIIAGAILISILLISLGIKVFNSTSGIVEETHSSSESTSKELFNSKFTKYFGSSVSGTQARALVNAVMVNNSTNSNPQIFINIYKANGDHMTSGGGHRYTVSDLKNVLGLISPNSNYLIQSTTNCGEDDYHGYKNGYIFCISIHLLP